jgi:hypothetical protein
MSTKSINVKACELSKNGKITARVDELKKEGYKLGLEKTKVLSSKKNSTG